MGNYELIATWEEEKKFWKEINVNDLIVEELKKIKAEIVAKNCGRCGVDTWDNCKTQSLDGWCDVFDDLKIIDKHISELKGEE